MKDLATAGLVAELRSEYSVFVLNNMAGIKNGLILAFMVGF